MQVCLQHGPIAVAPNAISAPKSLNTALNHKKTRQLKKLRNIDEIVAHKRKRVAQERG